MPLGPHGGSPAGGNLRVAERAGGRQQPEGGKGGLVRPPESSRQPCIRHRGDGNPSIPALRNDRAPAHP